MTRWLETDNLSDQDISSNLAIGSYTADADRSILCQFFVDQVVGDGNYYFFLTFQVAGAGSAYMMLPKATLAAAAGVTALGSQSIIVNVRSGDVLTAYLKGLVGDTTTPDTSVRWFELDVESAEDVWSYAVRTLTQSAASIIEVLTGTTINIYRGDTFNATITGLGSLVGYTSIDIAIKADRADADSEAIIWIRKNASEEDDGLLRVNGAAPINPLLGSIAIDSEPLGNITVTLDETITAILAPVSGLGYDIQMISADGIVTLGQGLCNVGADVVRAVV